MGSRRRLTLGLILTSSLAVAAIAAGRLPTSPQEPEAQGGALKQTSLAPLVQWHGDDTKLTEAGFTRITSENDWRVLWAKHTGQSHEADNLWWMSVPEVNFTRCMVIAYVRGDSTNNRGEAAVSVEPMGDVVRLRFDSRSYQTAGPAPDGGAQKCRPFGFWVIERTDKPIEIEEDVQGLIGKPPKWKQVHKFDAMSSMRR